VKTPGFLTTVLLVIMAASRALAQESVAGVLADPALDLRRPADRAKAVERIRTLENAGLVRARAKARAQGIPMRRELPNGGVMEIVGLDENGDFLIYTTDNANASITSGANLLNTSPYNLNGTGVTVGVWDGNAVRTTHREFANGRAVVRDGTIALDDHGTHVAGIIGALGVTTNARGMANNVSIDSYKFDSDASEMLAAGATAPGQAGKLYLSNHSYGLVAGWNNSTWTWTGTGTNQNAYAAQFGQYSSSAQSWDSIAFSTPYLLICKSAGNENSQNPTAGSTVTVGGVSVVYDPAIHPPGDGVYRNGYENMQHYAVSKNILSVGACLDAVSGGLRSPSAGTIATFSSRGPTDDGRIKPDVVANGWILNSTSSAADNAYVDKSGTSMAAPSATGSAALLVEQYAKLFNGGAMRSSTLKGLLIHTATDVGNPGPDYHYGWGLIDVKSGADLIADHHDNPGKKRMREERITTTSGSIVQSFRWDGSSPIRSTLCWTDPAGTTISTHDSRTPTLVNNLNLKLIAPDGTEFLPYVMPFVGTWTLASMSQSATTGVNNTDNVEQVYVQTPTQAGVWQAVVSYQGTLTNNQQDFSLLLSGTTHQQPLSPNIARYQNAPGSISGWSLRPELFATDGIASNFHRWRSSKTTGQWLEITYPRPVTIASAHLYFGVMASGTTTENWGNFKLQRDNGGIWTDIPGATVSGNTASERNVIFTSAVTSSKFRLLNTDTGGDIVRSVREVAMFGPNVVGGLEQGYPIGTGVNVNLAHKRPATASSINGTNYAIKAVDGYVDDSSRWLCNSGVAGEWLEIDLISTNANGDAYQAISSARLYSGDFATSTNALSDFTLQYWDTVNSVWAAIPGAENITGNTQTVRTVTFSSVVATNKVRLINNTTGSAKIAELQFFPPSAASYPAHQDVLMKAPPAATVEDFGDATHHLRVSSASLKLGLVGGNGVFTNDAAGSDALNWQLLLNHRDGSYRIRNVKNGQCLALSELSLAPDTLVKGETYTGMPHQCWILDYVNASQFRLLNAYSGLALQSLGGSTTPGASLAVVLPGSSALQQWDTVWQANHPKKGVAGTGNAFPDVPGETYMSYLYGKYQHASWSYSWGGDDTFASFMGPHHTFNPMQFSNSYSSWAHYGENRTPLDGRRVYMQSQGKPISLLGFNEPDHTEQAGMTVAQAIERWPRLQFMDTPLVGPCPANPTSAWNADFYTAANQLGYRVDYVPMHWYSNPNSSNLINKIKQLYTLYGRPVWLTEFSSVRWSGTATWTHASNYNFLAEFLWRAENLPELARHSLFSWKHEPTSLIDPPEAPRGNAMDQTGNLTPYGELYASWDGVAQILPQKAYHLHNHGFYQRMQSPASGNAFTFVTPNNSTAGTQWFLTPGFTANTYRIQTTRDGRPLIRTAGTPASIGTLGQADTATEWTLVPVVSGADHDGWYYLNHPLTNQRLKNNGNGTCTMVATTDTTNASKWRFIVPIVPDGGTSQPSLTPSTIAHNQAGASVPANTMVTYTLTFSEDIDAASVTAADFGNAGTATITIGSITETSPGVFTVQVTPTSGGTLIFRVNAGAVITNTMGTAINTTAAIADDATLTITSSPVTVTFNANGGSTASPASKSVTPGSTYGALATTTRTGYTFSGWFTATTGGTQVLDTTTVTNASAHTLYARWSPITYTVTYHGNGSTGGSIPVDSNGYVQGATVTVLGNTGGLTKADSNFADWNTASNGLGTSYAAGATFAMGASNVTLYAVWAPNNVPVVNAGPDQTVTASGSTVWTPASISTVAWYDAADAASLWADTAGTTPATTTVARWSDKSGNGFHLSQATSNRQPDTGVNTYNGKNVLTFTPATAENLFTSSTLTWDNVYIVCDNPDMSYGNRPTVLGGNTTTIYTMQFNNTVVDATPDAWIGTGYYVNGNTTAASSTDAALVASPTLIRRAAATSSDISIGSDRQMSNRAWNGNIAEVIYLNGASPEDRQKVEGYLAHKWGLNLPEGHPYRAAAPGNPAAVVSLDGTVSDADGQALTTTWSKVSGAGLVNFGDASATDTSATFTELGTYVLRLTANDGVGSNYDELTISVNETSSTYSVTYNGNGNTDGSVPVDSGVYATGATVTVLGNTGSMTKTGYTFAGWNTAVNGSGTPYAAGSTFTISNSTTLYAQWTSNAPPEVYAGPDQVVLLDQVAPLDPVAGAYFEWSAAADTPDDTAWSSTATAYDWTFDAGNQTPVGVTDARYPLVTKAYAFPAAKDATNTSFDTHGSAQKATFEFVVDIDGIDGSIFETGGNGDGLQVDVVGGVLRGTVQETTPARVSYTLTPTDLGRYLHVVFVADNAANVVRLYVDGELKDEQPWSLGEDWSGTDGASLGGVSGTMPTDGSTANFSGKLALFRYYKNTAFTVTDVTTNRDALIGGQFRTVALDGTVSDADGDLLTTTWSVVSGPASVTFGNPSAVDTTATFTMAGTYVLRLTAADAATSVSDDITITVLPDTAYHRWSISTFDQTLTSTDTTADPDNDGLTNLQEFAFDTDPTSPLRRSLQWADGGPLTQAGLPVLMKLPVQGAPDAFHAVFVRRKDYQAAGLTYTVYFSADLKAWTAENTGLFLEGENAAGTMEVLSIPYPEEVPLQGGQQSAPPKFFRVGVSNN
jgi:uncharacterized repeat protein (TIGR02543 family)